MAFNKAVVNRNSKRSNILSCVRRFLSFIQTDKLFLHQKFRLLVYLDHFSHIHNENIPGPVVEGIRTQASFILQKWRRQVIAGFGDHHPWIAGVDKSLLYIPKYECRRCYFFQGIFNFLCVVGFIVDLLTPEAAMNVIIRVLDRGTEEIKKRSDLPPLPNPL